MSGRRSITRRGIRGLGRAREIAHLLLAEYYGVTSQLRYHPSDRWRDDFIDQKAFFRRAFQMLAYNEIDGDYAEFGCFGGRTFALAWGAAELAGHPAHLWAFDSFEGLPPTSDPRDRHPRWTPGAMAMSEEGFRAACARHGIPSDRYTTVAGYYSDTLASPAAGPRPEKISLAHVDCDLYTSTTAVLQFLVPRLRPGMVVAFDDYYCPTAGAPSGERLACGEVFGTSERWQLLPFIQYGWHGMSFVVEERSAGPTGVAGW